MSPSVRSTASSWRENQSSGTRPARMSESVERRDEIGMGLGDDLAIVGHLADFPQALDVGAASWRSRASPRRAPAISSAEQVLGERRAA